MGPANARACMGMRMCAPGYPRPCSRRPASASERLGPGGCGGSASERDGSARRKRVRAGVMRRCARTKRVRGRGSLLGISAPSFIAPELQLIAGRIAPKLGLSYTGDRFEARCLEQREERTMDANNANNATLAFSRDDLNRIIEALYIRAA